ncbi:MAG: DUF370 domain-containing protein [Saccharofermentans sp.]|nr:DUF370 domain-containing protein [Saccharofermentans sp.]
MYIHIGSDLSVLKKTVISVINLEEEPPSGKIVTGFLKNEDANGRLWYVTDDLPKTVIVTDSGSYVSSLSAQILQKRLNSEDIC